MKSIQFQSSSTTMHKRICFLFLEALGSDLVANLGIVFWQIHH